MTTIIETEKRVTVRSESTWFAHFQYGPVDLKYLSNILELEDFIPFIKSDILHFIADRVDDLDSDKELVLRFDYAEAMAVATSLRKEFGAQLDMTADEALQFDRYDAITWAHPIYEVVKSAAEAEA